MKLKTYLRGLGVGIIVTAIVMAITLGGKKEKTSDEEIVARAKELGMVESVAEEPDANDENIPTEKEPESENTDGQESESLSEEASTEQNEIEESEPESEEESEPEGEEESESEPQSEVEAADDTPASVDNTEVTAGEIVSVSIVSGDDSATVSRRLEELDLVISAEQFDRFLCDNGYAKKLAPGNYEIAIGSSEETIAKIITKSR